MTMITSTSASTDAPVKRNPSKPAPRSRAKKMAAPAEAPVDINGEPAATPPPIAPVEPKPERINRTDQLIAQLRTPDGASIEDLCTRFGWLPHTARAALTVLRKRGLDVQRAKAGTVTVYRIATA